MKLPDVEKQPSEGGSRIPTSGAKRESLGGRPGLATAKAPDTFYSLGHPPGRRLDRARGPGRVFQQLFRAVYFR
ncbi:MAG TPA: hypothetical protein VNV14_01215 [Opitutaceae bacterium]|nr:hypothetical protein [Opitutaceae bacterium]